MTETITTVRPWYLGNAFLLLMTLLTVFLIGGFVGTDGLASYAINLLTIVAILFGLRRITGSKMAVRLTAGMGLILLMYSVGHHVFVAGDTHILDTCAALAFFLIPLVALSVALARATRVTADEVFAACCIYMLIGICFGLAFVIVHYFDAGAFTLSTADLASPGPALIHFSFTTLTTVGYGSISPVSESARTLSDIEAVLSQLYLAIVIARLVSLEMMHGGSDRPRS